MQSPWLSRRLESFQRASGDHTLNFDQKKCWEATEDHFVCLDKHHDVYDNHQKCAPSHAAWAGSCPTLVRSSQMVQRSVQKEALLLYGSQANLDEYNAQKNTTTAFWQRRNPVHMAPQFK